MGSTIEISAGQLVPAYLAEPYGEAKGAVIVIHEVWGLTDHIKSIADRVAAEGYIALAPDLFTEAGVDVDKLAGMQEALFDPKRRNQIQPELRKLMAPINDPEFGEQTTANLKDCFDYLYDLPAARQKVSVMGFCFGGSYSFNLAVAEPRLAAAIAFYGHADQDADTLKSISCPVQAFYGEQDERLVSGLGELREKMKAAAVQFETKVYPDCGHAFFNDTNRFAYNPAAAANAWKLVLDRLRTAV